MMLRRRQALHKKDVNAESVAKSARTLPVGFPRRRPKQSFGEQDSSQALEGKSSPTLVLFVK